MQQASAHKSSTSKPPEDDSRPHRQQVYPPVAQDRAISRIMQHVCGVIALQNDFGTSTIGALATMSELALVCKSSMK
jgi:hypothetical protein